MIDLHPDYLMFHTSTGETIPCSAEAVAIELVGESLHLIDPEIIHNAALAVLYYFKSELGRSVVTVPEFTAELVKVLRGFGLAVQAAEPELSPPGESGTAGPTCFSDLQATGPQGSPLRLARYDLRALAHDTQSGLPLAFFPRLRAEVRRTLREHPRVLQFDGLRGCVKLLTGARRWSGRCQRLSDEIVGFLRECVRSEPATADCALVVR